MEVAFCKECGGNACICDFELNGQTTWAAHCMQCENSTGQKGTYDPCHKSQEEAINAWNELNKSK